MVPAPAMPGATQMDDLTAVRAETNRRGARDHPIAWPRSERHIRAGSFAAGTASPYLPPVMRIIRDDAHCGGEVTGGPAMRISASVLVMRSPDRSMVMVCSVPVKPDGRPVVRGDGEPGLAPQVSPPALNATGVVTGNSFWPASLPSTYSWARPGFPCRWAGLACRWARTRTRAGAAR